MADVKDSVFHLLYLLSFISPALFSSSALFLLFLLLIDDAPQPPLHERSLMQQASVSVLEHVDQRLICDAE